MERGDRVHFEAIKKAIEISSHKEITDSSMAILALSPDDFEAKLCLIVSCLRTDNLRQLQTTIFKAPPTAKDHEELHLYYGYLLYLQGDYQKAIKYISQTKQSPKGKLLLAQAYYKNLEYETSANLMAELVAEKRTEKNLDVGDMLVNLFAACEGADNSKLQKLIQETKVGKTEHHQLLFNLALLFNETKDIKQARQNLDKFMAALKQPQDHQDLIATKLLEDYIQSSTGELSDIENKINQYEQYLQTEFKDKNLSIVVENNLTALKEIDTHYEHIKKYDDYISGKYKQTRQQLKILKLNKLIMLLKKNRVHDAGKVLKDLQASYPIESLLATDDFIKCKVSLLEKLKEDAELEKLLNNVQIKDSFLRFFLKAEHLRNKKDTAEIITFHKLLAKDNKQFSDSETINKYIFSIILKDQTLFDRELGEMQKMINTTSDLTILKILREIFAKKGQIDRETEILEKILKLNPKDQGSRVQLARVKLQSGDIDRCEELMKGLDRPDEITDMNHLQTLQNNIHFSITKKQAKKQEVTKLKKKIKKRRKRFPKNYDPENPGPLPNPQRWLPKFERKDFKKKKNYKSGRTQGATNVGKESVNTYTASHTTSTLEVATKNKRKHKR